MDPTARPLTLADVTDHVRDHVFGTADLPDAAPATRDQVGIELEWLTGYRGDQRLSLDQAQAVVADLSPLPRGSRITIEPGGQLELSSAPFATVGEALEGTATDLYVLDQACAQRRIDLYALGADPAAGAGAGRHRAALRRHGVVLRPPGRAVGPHDDVQHRGHPGQPRLRPRGRRRRRAGASPTCSARCSSPASPTRRSRRAARAAGSPPGSATWWALDPSRSSPRRPRRRPGRPLVAYAARRPGHADPHAATDYEAPDPRA